MFSSLSLSEARLATLRESATIAILGYGSQAHAHAQNLADSGFRVIVGLRETSPRRSEAIKAGLQVASLEEAVSAADLVAFLVPDEVQPELYTQLSSHLAGKVLLFAHGFNIHFGKIIPQETMDIILVAPKGTGVALRQQFVAGSGLAGLFAVAQNASGHAQEWALAYAHGIGCTRVGLIETTFAEETVTDLFGEQAVLCGGIPQLILAGFETLVQAGYKPEIAYFETVHEVKLIVDLLYERGFEGMQKAISNTAEYGGYQTGSLLINQDVVQRMQMVLNDIQQGRFEQQFTHDYEQGFPTLEQRRNQTRAHLVEQVGEELRKKVTNR